MEAASLFKANIIVENTLLDLLNASTLAVTGLGCSSIAISRFFLMAGAAGLALGGRARPVLGLADPALTPAVVGLAGPGPGTELTSSSFLPKPERI